MRAEPGRREAALPLPPATPAFIAPDAWRAIDFISDLHLAERLPALFDAWAAYLEHTSADAVFILGDLFEAWVGDEAAEQGFEARCVAVLKRAATTKTIAFMAGNRDFLVGDAMLHASGVVRLVDPTVVAAFGQRVLISHGDALCLGDVPYQRYRRIVHRPIVQRAFRALPYAWRRRVAQAMRQRGAPAGAPRSVFFDVDRPSVLGWAHAASASALVHGHTHAPASHEVAPGIVRHVLTDWALDDPRTTPRAEVLRWQADGFRRIAPEQAAAR